MDHIRIVLVETTHPGNIGGVARAMKNMALQDLALVAPHYFPDEQATARAAGADDLLQSARVFDTLDAALSDCQLVIGASARRRSIRWPELCPRTAAEKIASHGTPLKTAILFGREHSGLSNEELERCHYLLHIPCNEDFSSLNLGAAVQVVAYEIYRAYHLGEISAVAEPQPREPGEERATGEIMDSFYIHLEATLRDIGFLHERKLAAALLHRLHRIFNRAQLEKAEIHLLRGILTAAQRMVRRDGRPGPGSA